MNCSNCGQPVPQSPGIVKKQEVVDVIRYRLAGDPRWRYTLNDRLLEKIGRGEENDHKPHYDPRDLWPEAMA